MENGSTPISVSYYNTVDKHDTTDWPGRKRSRQNSLISLRSSERLKFHAGRVYLTTVLTRVITLWYDILSESRFHSTSNRLMSNSYCVDNTSLCFILLNISFCSNLSSLIYLQLLYCTASKC